MGIFATNAVRLPDGVRVLERECFRPTAMPALPMDGTAERESRAPFNIQNAAPIQVAVSNVLRFSEQLNKVERRPLGHRGK